MELRRPTATNSDPARAGRRVTGLLSLASQIRAADDESGARQLFLARQPVFDRRLRVRGYEILYRSSHENSFDSSDATAASLKTLHHVYCMGEQRLLDGHTAFLNFPRDLLVSLYPEMVDPHRCVVEILETVKPDAELRQACVELKGRGYRLALDDFTGRGQAVELLPLVDIVKVDIPATSSLEQEQILQLHRRPGLTFLAEKVETRTEFERLARLGYELFQGYFFARPAMASSRQPVAYKRFCVDLIRQTLAPEIDFRSIESSIEQDVALSYRLLRYVNSALFGLGQPVRSIRYALMLIGEERLRRWVTVMALAELAAEKPTELMSLALVRGLFCEGAAAWTSFRSRRPELFLLGLFSVLDVMTDNPMEEIIADLPLAEDIRDALLCPEAGQHIAALLLKLVHDYERGMWDEAIELGRCLSIDPNAAAELHLGCVTRASEIFAVAGGVGHPAEAAHQTELAPVR